VTRAPTALIIGAGSLGTLYGAALARAGLAVQLLARPAHAEAVEAAGGIRVEGIGGTWTAPLRATAEPARVEPAEIVVLLTQCQDTESALRGLDHVRDGVRLAVSLQNGGGKNEWLAAWCGEAAVVGGTSMVGATLDGPGRVRHTSAATTYLGELDGSDSRRVQALAAHLEHGGLATLVTDRVRAAEWSKLLNAAATMTIGALARIPVHAVFRGERTSRCYVEQIREGEAIARAHGVDIGNWPGMAPVATLCELAPEAAAEVMRDRGEALVARGETKVTPSMLRSILTGRPLEVEHVHGYLVREAERRGVAAPMLALAYAVLQAIDRTIAGEQL
jgi:2-dehydropantoate 2-reductase